MGTTDPGHGAADVYIDDQLVETINTHAESRSTGAKIFVSGDLEDGDHTLKLVAKNKCSNRCGSSLRNQQRWRWND